MLRITGGFVYLAVAGCVFFFGCADGAISGQGKPSPPDAMMPDDPGGPPQQGQSSATPRFSVSRHVFPDEDRNQIAADLDRVVELGAKMVRTDIWWFSVEPEDGRIDEGALDFFDWYVKTAAAKGIGVIAVLSNAPQWARNLYGSKGVDAYAQRFGTYVAAVAKKIGPMVTYYQMSNEINHTPMDFVENDIPVLKAARASLKANDPQHISIINVLVDGHNAGFCPSWSCDLDGLLKSAAAPDIDVVAIDYYPGTWSTAQDWNGDVLFRLFELGKKYGKQVAIMETGFASKQCLPWIMDREAGQANFVRQAFGAIWSKFTDPSVRQGVGLPLINWYELEDKNSNETNCLNGIGVEVLESHFGLLRGDRTKKPAFDVMREEIDKINAAGDRLSSR